MSFSDFALLVGYWFILMIIGIIISQAYYKNSSKARYFMAGLFLKLLGSIAFTLVYQFYYTAGDTFGYTRSSKVLVDLFWEDPEQAVGIWLQDAGERNMHTIEYTSEMNMYPYKNTYMTVRIASILGIFSFGNFYACSLLFGFLSFTGGWLLFLVFIGLYPNLEKWAFLSVFAVPSVVFWGGGIMKDTIIMASLGWITYGFYQFFILKNRNFLWLFAVVLCSYIVLVVKFYVIIPLLTALFWWKGVLVYRHWKRDPNFLKIATFFLFVGILGFVYLFGNYILKNFNTFLAFVIQNAIGYQTFHGALAEQGTVGSGYTFGEIDYTLWGVLSKMPASVNVTYYRPYVWECTSIVMLFSSFESIIFLLLSLYTLFKVGVVRCFRFVKEDAFLQASLLYILFLGFAVGFTSYNFGALVRYKIPCLPFFVFFWFVLLEKYRLYRQVSENNLALE